MSNTTDNIEKGFGESNIASRKSDIAMEFPEESMNQAVTRGELVEIMTQVVDNINQVSNFLMEDLNNLFQRFTYPTSLRLNAIENLLIQKGIMTKADIDKECNVIHSKAVKTAKDLKEKKGKQESESSDGGHKEGMKFAENVSIEKKD